MADSGRLTSEDSKDRIDSVFSAKVDEKGRVSIPSGIRKSLGLSTGSVLEIEFDLEYGIVALLLPDSGSGAASGRCSVADSTSGCGPVSSGSKSQASWAYGSKQPVEIPDSDPGPIGQTPGCLRKQERARAFGDWIVEARK